MYLLGKATILINQFGDECFFNAFVVLRNYIVSFMFSQTIKVALFIVELTSMTGKGTQNNMYNLRPGTTWLQDSPEAKDHDESTSNSELQFFDLNTIAEATNNFSSENEVGRGGFGSVFKVVTRESFSNV